MQDACAQPHAVLRRIVNRDFQSNTYLFKTDAGNGCVVIDPGLDREAIESELSDCGWTPLAVLCTHGHFDHVGGAAWLQQSYQVPVYLLEADLKIARQSNFLMSAFKIKHRIELPEFSLLQSAQQATVCAGDKSYRYQPLPGHTPGSAGIFVDKVLFSGDTLYARKTHLSRMPGEDHALLRQSLHHLFGMTDDDVRVFPGHGGNATMGEIREHNEPLRVLMAGGLE
jgi:glyoxylase-like metal-dependent hydrolase (beta-lactamase superfamily II)